MIKPKTLMSELYDAEGNLVDNVYTEEELEAEREKLKKDSDLAEAERKELEDLRKKDFNFNTLRKKAEKQEAPEKKEPEPKSDDMAPKYLDELKVEDEKLRRKAEHFYSKLTEGMTDPELKKIMMEDAVVLAKRTMIEPDNLAGAYSGSAGSKAQPSENPLSDPNFREYSDVFQLNEEDIKKYDPKSSKEWRPNLGK